MARRTRSCASTIPRSKKRAPISSGCTSSRSQGAEVGLVPAESHQEVIWAEFEAYARTALVQLRRVREGTSIPRITCGTGRAIVHWLLAPRRD